MLVMSWSTSTGWWCRRRTCGAAHSLLDIFAVVGIGGIWVAAFFAQLKKMPLLPLHDPRFEGVMEHQHGD